MRINILFICCLFAINGFSQISVTAGFNKDTVLIGDPVEYTVTIKKGAALDIRSINSSSLDSIISGVQTQRKQDRDSLDEPVPVVSDYTITDLGKWQDIQTDGQFAEGELSFDTTTVGNQTLLENTISMIFWDPGPQALRHPSLSFQYGDSLYQYPYSGVSQIFVSPPFDLAELESDSIDIADIKPIIIEEKNITDYYHWFILAAGILGIALIWFLITRLKNNDRGIEQKEIAVIQPAHVIALDRLHDLKEAELWQKGQIKEYQSKLTFAIREYLENRYDIQALESTTDEIAKELRTHNFQSEDEIALKEILQVADLVKFAKATPDISVHERFLGKAIDFVNKTKYVFVENEEKADS